MATDDQPIKTPVAAATNQTAKEAAPAAAPSEKYTGPRHTKEIWDVYPDGKKLQPWKWTDEYLEKFRKKNPKHPVLGLFEGAE